QHLQLDVVGAAVAGDGHRLALEVAGLIDASSSLEDGRAQPVLQRRVHDLYGDARGPGGDDRVRVGETDLHVLYRDVAHDVGRGAVDEFHIQPLFGEEAQFLGDVQGRVV